MAILLALCSSLAYGLSDFVGGLVSRRTSPWPVAVLGQLSSAACVLAVAVTVPGDPTRSDFLWAALAGVGGGLGTGFLYRGLASGRMGVVSPISAVGAAVVPVLAGGVAGERVSLVVWLGILSAMPGIWLVASTPADDISRLEDPGRPPARVTIAEGMADGVLSGLGFGLLFAALGQVPASAGLLPLALTQAVSVPAVIVLALALRARWVPRGRPVRWALLTGPLGGLATLSFLLATHRGYLTIAGVLASLYPASTVLLAASFLREPVHRAQAMGLGLCALAVTLVAVG
jgi:drug/metabolite transporter (DMT)-like permease